MNRYTFYFYFFLLKYSVMLAGDEALVCLFFVF